MKICLTLLAISCLSAQSPEDALRARVSKFYQAYVDGKARTLEPMVAEDSKDKWFSSEKIRYGSFVIKSIEFSNGDKQAKVTLEVESTMRVRGTSFTGKVPAVSSWKVEEGEWRFFYDPNVKEGDARKVRIPEPGELLGKVTAAKSEIKLCGCGEPVFDVAINNGMPGEVRLALEPVSVPGLRVSLKETTLKPNQSTRLILEYDGAEKPPALPVPVYINIDPTGERLVVKMIFTTTN